MTPEQAAELKRLAEEYVDAVQAEIAALRRKLEDARKDAERYAYLRNENGRRALALHGPEAGVWCDCEDAYENLVLLTGADLDAAIDAAMTNEG